MSQKEIKEFFRLLRKNDPTLQNDYDTRHKIAALINLANVYKSIQEMHYNGYVSSEEDQELDTVLKPLIKKRIAALGIKDFSLTGDARGSCIKLKVDPTCGNSMGDREDLCVPAFQSPSTDDQFSFFNPYFEEEEKMEERLYNCFTRTWWKENPAWPNGLEPDGGAKKRYHDQGASLTISEARAFCREYNDTHPPGRLSRKMEFEEA